MKKYLYTLLILVVVLIGAVAVKAAMSPLSGWAWSSTIGWISFSNGVPTANVVNVSDTGDMSGYVWSSNIGWIKFGGLSGFPGGLGTFSGNAKVDFSTGQVKGWARACSGTSNKDCTSASRTDGWDGWISLSGTGYESPVLAGNKGVTFSTTSKRFNGFGWGDTNVGWVDFAPILSSSYVECPGCGGGGTLSAVCGVTKDPSSGILAPGGTVRATYTGTGINGSPSYTYSWNGGGTSNPKIIDYNSTGTKAVQTVTVTDSTGATASASCTAVVVSDPGGGVPPGACPLNIPNAIPCGGTAGPTSGTMLYDYLGCPLTQTFECSFQCEEKFRLSSGECVKIIVNPT